MSNPFITIDASEITDNFRKDNYNRYTAIHKANLRAFGKAAKCENRDCSHDNTNQKRFHWALIKGRRYSRNREDYIQLCPSCHGKYDMTDEMRDRHRKRLIGETHNQAKLTNGQVMEIVLLINSGVTPKDIAKKYKIDSSTVSDIKRGKRWSHITGIKNEKYAKENR